MTSPTQRSLKLLRDEGYTVQVVERYNQFSRRRIDLFGFIDIVAIKPGEPGVLGIQTTSRSNQADRIKKSKATPELQVWLECENSFEVHGWAKVGARNKRKTWQVSRTRITLDS